MGEVGESGQKVPTRRRKAKIIPGDLSQYDFFFVWQEIQITIYFFRMCPYDY